ncbi:Crp/Fnr family transcriptional regulator [Pedobacter hartonius]|uniref:cAMP-binding domain of CRP or a regulatory subunit of cAMP-dependent protein kinases n=1 Tax=Pedobacter hartonius TaxID=425514 RepID=A0A1H4BPM6_9SPHI|nr:Crp/Fnr family transcriptional regulator [Pedobacter hartonius]SEA50027.1 cAMP-binding domain of CRP or a regulatory subunit of cAMP-dependent protein kinases [Pedobacter hartonius]
MNEYVNFLNKLVPMTEEEKLEVLECTSEKTYKKGEVIYSKGEICTHILFVLSGYGRSYSLDMNRREFTWNLNFNDQHSLFGNFFIFDFSSFLAQEPTELYIEAITDMKVIRMSYIEMKMLYIKNLKYRDAGRLLAEYAYYSMQKRSLTLLTMTAEARYEQMLTEQPQLLQKFQQYYIASYLGITPQSLSRLRSNCNSNI